MKITTRRRTLLNLCLIPLVATLASAIEVDSTADSATAGDGACTLREAVNNANLLAGGDTTGGDCAAGIAGADTITFSPGTNGIALVLTGAAGEDANLGGDLDFDEGVTIQGNGLALTVLDGGALDRVLDFKPGSDATVEIRDLTVRGGSVVGDGGGVFYTSGNPSILTLEDCHIGPNMATVDGGGLKVSNGDTTTLTLLRTTVDGNQAGDLGGGILLGIGGTNSVFIVESTVSANTAIDGGGIKNVAGGGVHHVVNSSISGNRATGDGGGINDGGGGEAWHLASSTITGNEADSDLAGGGTGGGVLINGPLSVRNTILAGNINALGGEADCDSSTDLVSFGFNLIQDDADCNVTGDTTGNVTGTAPGLGPRAANGGPTWTHEVLASSPALDAGNPAGCEDTRGVLLLTDQRGQPRTLDGDGVGGAICDIGSYERAFSPLLVEIPALGQGGRAALAGLLLACAIVLLRRRSATG